MSVSGRHQTHDSAWLGRSTQSVPCTTATSGLEIVHREVSDRTRRRPPIILHDLRRRLVAHRPARDSRHQGMPRRSVGAILAERPDHGLGVPVDVRPDGPVCRSGRNTLRIPARSFGASVLKSPGLTVRTAASADQRSGGFFHGDHHTLPEARSGFVQPADIAGAAGMASSTRRWTRA